MTLYNDLNRNGIQDAGEGAVNPSSGVITPYIDANNDGSRQSGEVIVPPGSPVLLPAGTYNLRLQLSGFGQSEPAANAPVTLTIDGTGTAQAKFGVYALATQLTGRVFYDADGSGDYDATADVGLDEQTVFFDRNVNGLLDPNEPSTLTNADGTYALTVTITSAVTGALRVATPLSIATPSSGSYPIALSSTSPPKVESLDFRIVAPASELQLNGTTLTVFGTSGNDTLELSRDALTGAVTVRQNGTTATFAATEVTTLNWLSAGGADALIERGSGLNTTISDSGPAGSASIVGGAGNDVFSVNGGQAYVRVDGADSFFRFLSVAQALPTLDVSLNDGRDSVVVTSLATTSGTVGFRTVAANSGEGDDALRVDGANVTLEGGGGNDRFYLNNGSATVAHGGAGIDAADSDVSDVLDGIEQGATAQLSGGNFTDEDLDGLLPGLTARGWVGACQSGNTIVRADALSADPSWTVYDQNPLGGFDLTRLLPGTYVITGTLTGTASGNYYPTTNGGSLRVTLGEGEINRAANLGWGLMAMPVLRAVADFSSGGTPGWSFPGYELLDRITWLDANDNGIREPNEPAVGGDNNPNVNPFKLVKGTYVFRTTIPDGWSAVSPQRVVYNVTRSGQAETITISERPTVFTGEISGRVVRAPHTSSRSPNGIGEGLAGITVRLDFSQPNGFFDYPGVPTTTTDAQGYYHFKNLPPLYRALPYVYGASGWGAPITKGEAVSTRTSSTDTGSSVQQSFALSLAATRILGIVRYNDDWDAYTDPVPAPGLGGALRVYADNNENGAWDASEPIAFVAKDGVFEIELSSRSDGSGPTFRVLLPAGMAASGSLATSRALDPYSTVSLSFAGQVVPASNTVGGRVAWDANANNIIDTSEQPQAGVTVWADLDANGTFDTGEPSTIADGRGAYLLRALPAGSYPIRAAVPTGYSNASYALSAYNGTSTISNGDIKLTRSDVSGRIAGVVEQTYVLNGLLNARRPTAVPLFVDLDNDGQLDDNEPRAASDAAGRFEFATSVPAGTYNIRVAPNAAGWSLPNGTAAVQAVVTASGQSASIAVAVVNSNKLQVIGQRVSRDGALPTVSLTFNDDVSSSLTADDIIVDDVSGHYNATSVTWDATTKTATWTLPNVSSAAAWLWFRNWRAYGTFGSLSTPLDPIPLYNVKGDINLDGKVDFSDLVILAQHYNQSGRTFGEGNLDRDPAGDVNFADLVLLAMNYHGGSSALTAFGAAQASSAKTTSVTSKPRTSIASDIVR